MRKNHKPAPERPSTPDPKYKGTAAENKFLADFQRTDTRYLARFAGKPKKQTGLEVFTRPIIIPGRTAAEPEPEEDGRPDVLDSVDYAAAAVAATGTYRWVAEELGITFDKLRDRVRNHRRRYQRQIKICKQYLKDHRTI
jgi:hypothetical protein